MMALASKAALLFKSQWAMGVAISLLLVIAIQYQLLQVARGTIVQHEIEEDLLNIELDEHKARMTAETQLRIAMRAESEKLKATIASQRTLSRAKVAQVLNQTVSTDQPQALSWLAGAIDTLEFGP